MREAITYPWYFYSRPCGRGDLPVSLILSEKSPLFLLTPLREGRPQVFFILKARIDYFYSRPCGRGDKATTQEAHLAEIISTHAPAGGATVSSLILSRSILFLLTPLREGRLKIKR